MLQFDSWFYVCETNFTYSSNTLYMYMYPKFSVREGNMADSNINSDRRLKKIHVIV